MKQFKLKKFIMKPKVFFFIFYIYKYFKISLLQIQFLPFRLRNLINMFLEHSHRCMALTLS